MRRQMIKVVLWFHTTIMTLAGLSLFIFPKTFGIFWPWALPPLAARFMGALLIGGGVCTALAALAAGPIPVEGAALLGVGDLLIVSVALLNKGEISFSGNTIIWLTVFTGMALLLLSLPLLRGRQMTGEGDQSSPMRGLNRYFLIHLAVVIQVARGVSIRHPRDIGICYQATSATFLGRTEPRTIRLLPDGTLLSDRTIQKIRDLDRFTRMIRERGMIPGLSTAGAKEPYSSRESGNRCRRASGPTRATSSTAASL